LSHYNTYEAAQDIEDIRKALGGRPLTLFGVSYGTGLTQMYSALYPGHLQGIILDGTVDTSMSAMGWVISQHARLEYVLRRTFAECAKSAACSKSFRDRSDTGMLAAYDAVAAHLQAKPEEIAYPLKTGGTSLRIFSRADLDSTTLNALDSPKARHKLAAAIGTIEERGDYVPLQSLAYEVQKIDPETAGPIGIGDVTDPSGSWGVGYAFGCNDFASETAALSTAEREAHYLEPGRSLWGPNDRVLSPHFGDVPCAYWPVEARSGIPRRLAVIPPSIPLLVVGATGDANTSFEEGLMVARRSYNAHAVTYDGGNHSMTATGVKCIDQAVGAFLTRGVLPSVFETKCAGDFIVP
jgi:pimeloyl-ACP methyl ester carboxylesterase